jgi:hypothetical protein
VIRAVWTVVVNRLRQVDEAHRWLPGRRRCGSSQQRDCSREMR